MVLQKAEITACAVAQVNLMDGAKLEMQELAGEKRHHLGVGLCSHLVASIKTQIGLILVLQEGLGLLIMWAQSAVLLLVVNVRPLSTAGARVEGQRHVGELQNHKKTQPSACK